MHVRSLLLRIALRIAVVTVAVTTIVVLSASLRSFAAPQASDIPPWLRAHIGPGDGQIAPLVLQRARALYQQKIREGAVNNPCYFAMDATRPSTSRRGGLGRRFYIICEADRSFRAISSGYGSGRHLRGLADFSNGRECAKNFSNAEGSMLTTGGSYVTAETRTSFKGYHRVAGKVTSFSRSFLQFEGDGDTANARERAIGGHPAVVLRWSCRRKDPDSPHADKEGYVPYGTLTDYTAGRSNGCTSWSPRESETILAMVKDQPATLYIYPESSDIDAVAQAVKTGQSLARAGLYWDDTCLRAIRAPKFWPKETLEPIIAQYRKAHAPPPGWQPRPLPICKGP